MTKAACFFFYGTLIAGSANRVARAIHARLRPAGPATVTGRLYAIPDPRGWYPALMAGPGTVHGALYEAAAGFGARELARLDAYEDFDPGDPAASLYLRDSIPVETADGTAREAQAYVYNRPLPPGALPVEGGDFRAWLGRHGFAAFGG